MDANVVPFVNTEKQSALLYHDTLHACVTGAQSARHVVRYILYFSTYNTVTH